MNIALPALNKPVLWSVAAMGAVVLGLTWPEQTYATLRFVLVNFWDVAPTIAIGIVLSAWVAASGAGAVSAKWFAGRPVSTIVVASAIGTVTPVCGVTVLPLMTGFLAAGVPLAPIMAFWLSSPITDPAMFAVTWAVLGPAFAIGKTIAAFALGLFAGAGTAALTGTSAVEHPLRSSRSAEYCSCLPARFSFQIWREPARMQVFRGELLAMTRLIGLCLGLAFSAEHLLRDLLPPDLLATYVGKESAYAIPLAVMVGVPMYLDGYAALPLVRGLLDAGMSPGAAMAFLVSGGAVSIWGVMAVVAVLRPATIALFVVLATVGSLAIGYGFDAAWALLP
ncbi:permease [Taklimakanibacter deserti]|uniref:permease n=1 Tax=Taklimakanibacter deserti TaxID=2267839 RepID=UPI000E65890B